MIGAVSYWNSSRRFLLLTPIGRKRDHDVFCHEIQFELAEIEPYLGMKVQFAVVTDENGKCEAADIQLLPPEAGINDRKVEATVGAAPAAGWTRAAASNVPEAG